MLATYSLPPFRQLMTTTLRPLTVACRTFGSERALIGGQLGGEGGQGEAREPCCWTSSQ